MANESGGSAFARDLGYLDKFFVNIANFAGTLPEAEGARLKALMAEEVERWAEIRQLLGTAPAAKASESAPAAPVSQKPVAPVGPPPAKAPSPTLKAEPVPPRPLPVDGPKAPSRPGFTVGSLYGQPKK